MRRLLNWSGALTSCSLTAATARERGLQRRHQRGFPRPQGELDLAEPDQVKGPLVPLHTRALDLNGDRLAEGEGPRDGGRDRAIGDGAGVECEGQSQNCHC